MFEESALFWNTPLYFFRGHVSFLSCTASVPQTSFEKQTKGGWNQTINNADAQIGVKCFGFRYTNVYASMGAQTHTQIHFTLCFPVRNIYS